MATEPVKSQHIYGPVPSRRLGRSLGIDLVPFKICTYDCIYCQLGRTTCKTTKRMHYVPLSPLIRDIKQRIAEDQQIDYITIAGSGEPTLHVGLKRLIEEIKSMTDVPVAVITNGSLLWDEDVRRSCARADLVMPSLDAGDQALFDHVNRPHPNISFERLMQGLIDFRRDYKGIIWLEVFLLGGINGIPSEVSKMKRRIDEIGPDRVQVNTAVRPPAESFAFPVPEPTLQSLCRLLGEKAEVIASFPPSSQPLDLALRRSDILDLLSRRPCTIDDIASGLSVNRNEVVKLMSRLQTEGVVQANYHHEALFYELPRTLHANSLSTQ